MPKAKMTKESNPNNLQSLRKRHQLTKLEVAIKVGASVQSVTRWENGKAIPAIKNLLKIAKVYNTQPEKMYPEPLTKVKDELAKIKF